MRLSHLTRQSFNVNSLSSFYGINKNLTTALALKLTDPVSVSNLRTVFHRDPYKYLLQSCLQQCKKLNSHHLFDEMPQRVSQALTFGKIIHGKSLILGFCSKGSLGNSTVDLYAKCGDADLAEKAFFRLEERDDIVAWNSILSMYSRRVSLQHVGRMFCLVKCSGVGCNEYTYSIVLSACARMVDVEFGRQVHCDVVKVGLEESSYCGGALIDMYAKCACVFDARRVFDQAVERDVVSWTAMIAGYVQVNLPEEAVKVFENMVKDGRVPDQVAYVTVINAYVSLGRLDEARKVFSAMPSPNVVAWNVLISGHAKKGYEDEAVTLFHCMRDAGIKPTRSTLGSVLSAIAGLGALDHGLLVHAIAIKLGLSSNVYVGSSLISMYTKCENMETAKMVFDTLDERNVVLWNSMLGGYAQNGYSGKVMEMFFMMKEMGFQPDEYTYTSILSACACLEYLEVGRQLHGIIIKHKLISNLYVGNALVDMYAKTGALVESWKQFECLTNRDRVSWNSIIVGYVQEEDENEAFNMFRQMNLSNLMPDEVALASILSACANVLDFKKGQQVHSLAVKIGLEAGLYSGSSLIDMYAKCGDIRAASVVFSHMPNRSVVSMNTMIAAYAKKDMEEAINVFRQMKAFELSPSPITCVSLLDACNENQDISLGKQVHCLVVKYGLCYYDDFLGVSLLGMYMSCQSKKDFNNLFLEFPIPRTTTLWTALISGYNRNDCNEEALQSFKGMRIDNAIPDQATFASVLKACSVLSSLRDGRQIHTIILHLGYNLDELTSSSLVDMYAKCGDVKSSFQVFNEMTYRHDVVSWNSMIVGFAKNGFAEDALAVYHEMKHANVTPDDVTFLGALTACSHAGKVEEGRHIYNEMVHHYIIQPRVDHCACMVDLLGRWGFLKEAEEFVDSLDFEDAMIWATLLGACRLYGDEMRGKRAAENLIALDPQNSASYVLLSNIYAASGNWPGVNLLRREMREKGVKKLPGCSWISVGQKTELFVAGDESHSCALEMREVLKDLTAVMKEDGHNETEDVICEVH